jgi:sarcosine oxidase gamma subunit
MHDLGQYWPPIADWDKVRIARHGLTVRPVPGLSRHLVSGALSAFAGLAGLDGEGVGALGLAMGQRYMVRLARDRLLAVGLAGELAASGWHEAGFAVTDVSAAFQAFEIEGALPSGLLAEATAIDPAHPGPSAAVVFAGMPVILHAHGAADRLLLHIEQSQANALWSWLKDWAASRGPAA